ncbi:DUF7159 family protein [Mycobacterium sp. 050128]|uniref:DUF7159 family protein n=1 Tax=Mycobacterium sp. 050128 TaxID=3096112 RepID=UPI003FA59072
MDTVLGVSMAPTAVRMVLVEGENGDGATVDEDNFDVASDDDAATTSAADQVVSAILGTQEGAAQGGYQLTSTGVTWTDPIEAAALRDALAAHKVENVMLVSAFLAAAALAQAVGNETNYAQTALLFIEPDTATLALVDTADGSIADVHRQPLPEDDDAAVAQLATMVSEAETLDTRPGAVFVVGSGVDVPLIKPALEAATTLPLAMPEEPDTALARGAALASAHAPLFASSTAAQAYAQDPGTGAIDPFAIAPGYFDSPDSGEGALAYSAVPESYVDAYTGEHTAATSLTDYHETDYPERRSFGLVGSVVASIFIVGVAALVVSLAVAIRPTAGVKPVPSHNIVAPATPAPAAPAPAAPAPAPAAPAPEAAPIRAPAPVPQAPAPAPILDAPAPVPVQVPDAPAPIPDAPAPVPVPAAPAPAPVAPIPVPIPLPIPPVIGVPGVPIGPGGGGFPGNQGRGGGGFPGNQGPGVGGFPGGGHGGDFPGGGGHGGGGLPGFPGGGGGGHGGFGGGHGGFGRH